MQIGRSSASSVAFGMGLFAGQGTLGAGKHRAFSVITDTKVNDIHLRFHDTCMAYKVRFCHNILEQYVACTLSTVAPKKSEALKY